MNVLLIIIDTLRADHLGYWGYERDVSPTLDSLARAGTAWMQMQSQSSWTLPATASILTGLSPREHGAGIHDRQMYGLSGTIPNLQGILRSAGWQTCGIFNVVFLGEEFGFSHGFDHFDCEGVTGLTGCRRADRTVDDALEWLHALQTGSRFLAVIHFYDPHIPYNPPPHYDTRYADPSYDYYHVSDHQLESVKMVNNGTMEIDDEGLCNLIDLYDGEIAFTDAEIGILLREMRNTGLTDSLLVIVVADHGEEFLEHSGLEHGRNLYQETTHVPLIMCGPGIPEGVSSDSPAAQIDILPTILSYLGIPIPPGLSGRNLLDSEYAELDIPASNLLWSETQQASIRRNNIKVIWNSDGSAVECYNLSSDPGEQNPVQPPDSSLIESVEYYWATPPVAEAPSVYLNESSNDHLRDLGYIR